MRNLKILSFKHTDNPEKLQEDLTYADNKTKKLVAKIKNLDLYLVTLSKIDYKLLLDDRGKTIGTLEFFLYHSVPVTVLSFLEKSYRGKGYGYFMYDWILKKYKQLISDEKLSKDVFKIFKKFYGEGKLVGTVLPDKNILDILKLEFDHQIYKYGDKIIDSASHPRTTDNVRLWIKL